MASPFENLLQAAQFAVQTRANYDQMAERRRENTMNLMQRRSEQEQQNQQFLSEMNLKDRQQRMQADQFDRTLSQQYNFARMQDIAAAEDRKLKAIGLDITERGQEADIKLRAGMLGVSQGELALRREQMAYDRAEKERLRAAEAEANKPISLGEAPGLFSYSTQEMGEAPTDGLLGNVFGKSIYGIGKKVESLFAPYGKRYNKSVYAIGEEAAQAAKAQFPVAVVKTSQAIEKLEKKVSESLTTGKKIDPLAFSKTILGIKEALKNLEKQGTYRNSGEYNNLLRRYSVLNQYISPEQPAPQQ